MQPPTGLQWPQSVLQPLTLTVDPQAGLARLAGELDRFCAERMTDAVAALTRTTRCTLVVDVAKLTFCDVEGLRALARAGALARDRGFGMRLLDPSPWLTRLLRLAGLADLVRTPPVDGSGPAQGSAIRTDARHGSVKLSSPCWCSAYRR
ncbi:STAS domain-containing protein [Blastococcus sp. LR1]|uniref:STAS domain-containing protein n=1 Tax=Blastococcus sp. LR1 TaxID=2877000 RepID=UPI001CCD1E41|nr:STAS domain-containing protein [Blastococcus sp. LR1]MCA0143976.1 STAS domain-containing protein [Blastococcus sp. LR1]